MWPRISVASLTHLWTALLAHCTCCCLCICTLKIQKWMSLIHFLCISWMDAVRKKDLRYRVAARSIMEWGTPPRHACAYLSATKSPQWMLFIYSEQRNFTLSYILSVCIQNFSFNHHARDIKESKEMLQVVISTLCACPDPELKWTAVLRVHTYIYTWIHIYTYIWTFKCLCVCM